MSDMSTRTPTTIASLLLALSLAGCQVSVAIGGGDAGARSSDAASSDAGPTDAAPCEGPSCVPLGPTCATEPGDDFCPEYASARCAGELGCCTDPSVRPASLEACIRATVCECVSLRAFGPTEDGIGELDAAAADALLSRLRSSAPSCAIAPPYELRAESAFRGALADGEDCSPLVGEESFRACAVGLYCDVTSVAVDGAVARGTCRRFAAVGEACDTAECDPAASCDDDAVCRARGAEGAPCGDDEQCESDACDLDDGTCAPRTADDAWCAYGGGPDEE